MARRQFSNTSTEATLTGGIDASLTSFTLTSFAGYPVVPFTATISRGEADEEVVLVTAVSSDTVTVTRGYDQTTAKAHSAGATFLHTVVAKDFDEANDHINKTTGIHGLTGTPVGTTDTQTLTNKTLTTPTLTSPTWSGTASGATLTLSGALTVTGALGLTGALTGTTATFTGAVSGITPTLAAHLVRKDYVDAINTALDARLDTAEATLAAATAAVTPNTLVKRDGSGNVAIDKITLTDAASAASDAIRKDYADAINTALDARLDVLEADSGWISPSLGASWVNYGSGYVSTRYRKIRGKVEVQIMVKNGTTPGLLFTLPAGYRPSADLPPIMGIANLNNPARIDVEVGGQVRIYDLGGGTNGYVSALFTFHADA